MTIFAIIVQPNVAPGKLSDAIAAKIGDAKYVIDGGHGWLVASTKTAKELSDELGITDGTNGGALVLEVASYFGRANPSVWTWIKNNWETAR